MDDDKPLTSLKVPRPVPVALSFVAGYVDSCTYLALFGVFVAQVTGSFVLAGTQFFKPEVGAVAKSLAIPFFFFAGFGVTVLLDGLAGRPRIALAWSLGLECVLLIGFLAMGLLAAPFRDADDPAAIATLLFGLSGMGVQSALVKLLMRGSPSTNVMTTNTTQLSIDVAEALIGLIERRRAANPMISNQRYAQARAGIANFLPVALGFLAGTVAGAASCTAFGFGCAGLAVLILVALIIWVTRWRPA